MKSSLSFSFLEAVFLRSWWVILFTFLCLVLYEQALQKRNVNYAKLSEQKNTLQAAKEKALEIQEALLLQVNSESDPAWIELTLMQKLGLAPEGQIKVFFTKQQ